MHCITFSIDFSNRTIQRCSKSSYLKSFKNIIQKTNFILLIFYKNLAKTEKLFLFDLSAFQPYMIVLAGVNFKTSFLNSFPKLRLMNMINTSGGTNELFFVSYIFLLKINVLLDIGEHFFSSAKDEI